MKKLIINWTDLSTTFEEMRGEFASYDETSNYLDKECGQVLVVDMLVDEAVESIMQEVVEGLKEDVDWTDEDIRRTPMYVSLEDSFKFNVLAAIQIQYANCTGRYEQIPTFESYRAFQWMEGFVNTLDDDAVRGRLSAALRMRKPFRSFRAAMGSDRRLQQEWKVFELACQRETMIVWLESIDIEPLNPDESTYNPPPLPGLRKIMFAEVRRFVRFARDLPGVQRIALIGSLTTEKEFPKDIDILVTITDDFDLTELARLGRELAGHMVAHTSGADVFLASPTGEYLGRTCAWKRCGPGVRASCDARSCGARHYLHDDLSAIRLSKTTIEHPPLLLWPDTKANSAVPRDVLEQLIHPLLEDPQR